MTPRYRHVYLSIEEGTFASWRLHRCATYLPRGMYGPGPPNMTEKCRKCGADLPVSTSGRPATYCSTGCRRAAEYEIRRPSRRLESLETERDVLLVQLAEPSPYPHAIQRARGALKATEAAMARYEARLRDLLDEPDNQNE